MSDLTVIYLTANEHPAHWEKFHREKLLEAIGEYPLITLTFKPLGLPGKEMIQDEPKSPINIYRQILRACKAAETPFVAIAESDVLYSKEHFSFFRPKMDQVAYDMSKWALFTWRPVFSMRNRFTNATLIAPREYLIEVLERRYGDNALIPRSRSEEIVGEVGRHIHEDALGIPRTNFIEVWCYHPSVILSHENGFGFKLSHHPLKKTLGQMKALEIPNWGRAEDLVKEYR